MSGNVQLGGRLHSEVLQQFDPPITVPAMDMRDLIAGEAELDEENDESFDEDTGEVRGRENGVNGHIDDSSEEEEDDDDEEAARAVRLLTLAACPRS